ncbi:hypothetical protein AHAS_Ahas16G0230600 [Arachis hypogaea]
MMMARTASYIPKTDSMPSFSLGFTDSSQEETTMQEGASTQDEHREKTPETPKLLEQLEDLFDNICRLQAQDIYTLSKFHLVSLAPKSHIEAKIVTAMCFIINQQNIQRFQEEVYCLPPDIVNMALANHPDDVFLQPKNDKPFKIFAPVCHSHHYWLWIADTRKRKFYIVDPLHNKSPSDARTALNKFVGYVISRINDMDREIVAPYLKISGQKTSYDCAINDEVDHFRVEYASRILFHDMNLDKDEAIRGSNAIRLSKPSSLLLSPYCQIDSQDVDTT